MDDRRYRV